MQTGRTSTAHTMIVDVVSFARPLYAAFAVVSAIPGHYTGQGSAITQDAASVTSIEVITSTQTITAKPSIQANGHSEPKHDDFSAALKECDFALSSLCPLRHRPLRIVTIYETQLLRLAASQASIFNRLLYRHREKLSERIGEEKWEHLQARLAASVEEPMRFACSHLKRLNEGMPNMGIQHRPQNEEQREIVTRLYEKFRFDVANEINNVTVLTDEEEELIAELARIDELGSESCLDQNCFMIHNKSLDKIVFLTLHNLFNSTQNVIKLLTRGDYGPPQEVEYTMRDVVWRLEEIRNMLQEAGERVRQSVSLLYERYNILFTREVVGLALLIGFLNLLSTLITSNEVPRELGRWGARL
ncbi:hypothetical protein GGS21DRAFT_503491 [Xylaria nigripes]|nr:hypothetical protein GGS21DRAFT_503491 [Xylaria nigripes]